MEQIISQLAHEDPGSSGYDNLALRLVTDEKFISKIHEELICDTTGEDEKMLAAKALAELAKSECTRELFLADGLIPVLVNFLNHSNYDLVHQATRALGNLCYEKDVCREAILKQDGVSKLHQLLSALNKRPNIYTPLKTACCGFLHNLINGNENLQKACLESGIVNCIKPMLELHSNIEPICNFCYMALSSLTETEGGNAKIIESGVFKTLLKIFINTNVNDTEELLLTLLTILCTESDDVKKQIAESSADMHLMNIISMLSSSTNEDEQHIIKCASEFIVLVLTGDEAMSIWFDGGNGLIFTSVCEWLKGPNGQLLQSAAFAIGNFARDDGNSNILIQKGVSSELCNSLDQLISHKDNEKITPTIHSILSALRNMAIAGNNKRQLIQQGLVQRLTPLLSSSSVIVTSKLISVFRLLTDKQEEQAHLFGRDLVLIKRVKELTEIQHTTLYNECVRFLAWIVKNSRDVQIYKNIIETSSFKLITGLLKSEFPLMINEGLISIVLIISTVEKGLAVQTLIENEEIFESVKTLLHKEDQNREVLSNSLVLLHKTLQLGLKKRVEELDISDTFKSLSESDNSTEQIKSLADHIHSLTLTNGEISPSTSSTVDV